MLNDLTTRCRFDRLKAPSIWSRGRELGKRWEWLTLLSLDE